MGVILSSYEPHVRCDAPKLMPHWVSCVLLLAEMVATKQTLTFGWTGTAGVDVELPFTITSRECCFTPVSDALGVVVDRYFPFSYWNMHCDGPQERQRPGESHVV